MTGSQIVLIVVGVVLVVIAVLVGVTQVRENPATANENAVSLKCAEIVERARIWYDQSASPEGPERSFEGLTLQMLNVAPSDDDGSYELLNVTGKSFRVIGTGVEDGDGDGEPLKIRLTFDALSDSTVWETLNK